jgi:hypothetical protein
VEGVADLNTMADAELQCESISLMKSSPSMMEGFVHSLNSEFFPVEFKGNVLEGVKLVIDDWRNNDEAPISIGISITSRDSVAPIRNGFRG